MCLDIGFIKGLCRSLLKLLLEVLTTGMASWILTQSNSRSFMLAIMLSFLGALHMRLWAAYRAQWGLSIDLLITSVCHWMWALLNQADVPVPLSVLLDHIEERESADTAQSGLTLYFAQKDIREHLPDLALNPSKLPLLVRSSNREVQALYDIETAYIHLRSLKM